jgi:hypothetical protein
VAASLWLIVERPDIVPERDLPAIIRRFNESVGGVNDYSQGYHGTITQVFLAGIRLYLARIRRACRSRRRSTGCLRRRRGSATGLFPSTAGSVSSRFRRGWAGWRRIFALFPESAAAGREDR